MFHWNEIPQFKYKKAQTLWNTLSWMTHSNIAVLSLMELLSMLPQGSRWPFHYGTYRPPSLPTNTTLSQSLTQTHLLLPKLIAVAVHSVLIARCDPWTILEAHSALIATAVSTLSLPLMMHGANTYTIRSYTCTFCVWHTYGDLCNYEVSLHFFPSKSLYIIGVVCASMFDYMCFCNCLLICLKLTGRNSHRFLSWGHRLKVPYHAKCTFWCLL